MTAATGLPEWPAAVPLAPAYRSVFDSLLPGGDRYSEWHFPSARVWDTDGSARLSALDGGLVLDLPGRGGTRVVSVAGCPSAAAMRRVLDARGKLDVVPAPTAARLSDDPAVLVVPDDRNSDYVYDLTEQTALAGMPFKPVRYAVNSFRRNHPAAWADELDLDQGWMRAELAEVYDKWAADMTTAVRGNERDALLRALDEHRLLGVRAAGVVESDQVLGCYLLDVVGEWAVGHFFKVRHRDTGLYHTVRHAACVLAMRLGARWLNEEQDGGLPGLRSVKRRARPVRMLEKAVVIAA